MTIASHSRPRTGLLTAVALCALAALACGRLPAEPGNKSAKHRDPCEKLGRIKQEPVGPDSAAPADESVSAEQQEQLLCYKRHFQRVDDQLNRVYRHLSKQLPEPIRTDLRDNSRGWVQAKEYYCGFQSEIDPRATPVQRKISLLACTSAFIMDRTDYLRRAFGRDGVNSRVYTGAYGDGYSGDLDLKALGPRRPGSDGKARQKYKFAMQVVRGPTAHIGEIDGEVEVVSRKDGELYGLFAERADCPAIQPAIEQTPGGKRPCCRIEFRLSQTKGFRQVDIKEHSCGDYHGARAYFDGVYRKVR